MKLTGLLKKRNPDLAADLLFRGKALPPLDEEEVAAADEAIQHPGTSDDDLAPIVTRAFSGALLSSYRSKEGAIEVRRHWARVSALKRLAGERYVAGRFDEANLTCLKSLALLKELPRPLQVGTAELLLLMTRIHASAARFGAARILLERAFEDRMQDPFQTDPLLCESAALNFLLWEQVAGSLATGVRQQRRPRPVADALQRLGPEDFLDPEPLKKLTAGELQALEQGFRVGASGLLDRRSERVLVMGVPEMVAMFGKLGLTAAQMRDIYETERVAKQPGSPAFEDLVKQE